MATITTTRVTPEEYLEFERRSEVKHEYRDGEIVEMPGGTREHNLIATNLLRILSTSLFGKDFEVYPGNMRVKAPEANLYTYPDVVVVQGEPLLEDDQFDTLLNPAVLFEVLSPSTESYDRGDKFADCGTIESLTDYVSISQDKQRVESYSRQAGDAEWSHRVFNGPDAVVELTSIGCSLKLSDLYYKVPLAEPRDLSKPL
jgi:Uma2 family endonuclease